jgi:hypothetical protein
MAVGLSGVSETDVSTGRAPLTVRIAGLLTTEPEEAMIWEVAGLSNVLTAIPAPFVIGLPSEDHVIEATNGWLYWSNALAVKANVAPGATVREDGDIEMWSRCAGGLLAGGVVAGGVVGGVVVGGVVVGGVAVGGVVIGGVVIGGVLVGGVLVGGVVVGGVVVDPCELALTPAAPPQPAATRTTRAIR